MQNFTVEFQVRVQAEFGLHNFEMQVKGNFFRTHQIISKTRDLVMQWVMGWVRTQWNLDHMNE